MSTLTRAAAADQSSVSGGGTAQRLATASRIPAVPTTPRGISGSRGKGSGGGTALYGRPTSASADRSTSTDLISTELVSPDVTSACPDASAAVFRPIRRPYGTVSSQDEDFSFFDTEDDDDDDLRYNGLFH